MPTTLQQVLDVLRAYCSEQIPGETAVYLDVTFRSGLHLTHPISLPLPVAVAPEKPKRNPARHSQDFRSVCWFGAEFTFTALQAAVLRVLWEAWEDGTPEVGRETILQAAGSESERLRDVFRDHPAWGTLIVTGSQRGTYLLAEP